MWECKKCGDSSFGRDILKGFVVEDFYKDGELKENEIVDIDYGNLKCYSCSNEGTNIKDIAEWCSEEK